MHNKILYVRSMNDNDIFLTVNDMREPDELCAVGDEYIGMGMITSKIQISDFIRSNSCALRHA